MNHSAVSGVCAIQRWVSAAKFVNESESYLKEVWGCPSSSQRRQSSLHSALPPLDRTGLGLPSRHHLSTEAKGILSVSLPWQ